jgi:GMP synthase (glutamine-hydrolysing)
MRTLLIVKLGGTYSFLAEEIGDFEDWIIERSRSFSGKISVVSPVSGEPLPPISSVSGIILTGSHAMVTSQERWSEETAAWLVDALREEKPILGICYGHQLLAYALGGIVGYNPLGMEFGTTDIHLCKEARQDPIFRQLPSSFPVQVCHAQSVLELPANTCILASNAHDPHHVFRYGGNAWGVQFHPEYPPAASRIYIETEAEELRSQGKDPERLLQSIRSTPEAESILDLFGKFVEATTSDM